MGKQGEVKMHYEELKMEVIFFEEADIITDSSEQQGGGGDSHQTPEIDF